MRIQYMIKVVQQNSKEMMDYSNKWCQNSQIAFWKKTNLDASPTSYTRINSKWIKDLMLKKLNARRKLGDFKIIFGVGEDLSKNKTRKKHKSLLNLIT